MLLHPRCILSIRASLSAHSILLIQKRIIQLYIFIKPVVFVVKRHSSFAASGGVVLLAFVANCLNGFCQFVEVEGVCIYVQFCPNCGYAAYKLDRDLLYGNRAFLQSAEYKQIVQDENLIIDAKKFYLLGLIQENNNDKQKAATAFLRAGWFFQDNGNQEWMIKSKEKAIENMISSDFTWSNTQLVAILVDMLRTIGKFDEAIKIIDKYGFDNIKEEDEIKLFKYQIKLCEIKDSASHAIYDIDQETN